MKDILAFKTMITPIIIQILFWIGTTLLVISGLIGLFHHEILSGILLILLGPLFVRIMCESLILLFRIHASLESINNKIH